MITRTQITGLGPVMPDGSRRIFDKDPKPFIASADWFSAQVAEPRVGDYLDAGEDGTVVLVPEAVVDAQRHATDAPASASASEAQKKTDGGEELAIGSNPSQFNYRAKPVEVQAYEIVSVAVARNESGSLNLALSNGDNVQASAAMLSRIMPQSGDYWVVQADGYIYLNPREVFERKYEPIEAVKPITIIAE